MVETGSINRVASSEKSTESAAQRNRIVSGILTANWNSFALLLNIQKQSCLTTLPHDLVLDLAEDAIERGGPETLPWIMSCLKHFLHKEKDTPRARNLLSKTFSHCFEHRKSELFWTAIREFIKMAFSSGMMSRNDLEEDLLKVNFIKKCFVIIYI